MSEVRSGIRAAASFPAIYASLRIVTGGRHYWREFTSTYVRCTPQDRVLDIGCGPGQVRRYLDCADYIGFDRNPRYIHYARQTYGGDGQFHCMELSEAALPDSRFDIVLAMGIMHHLDDQAAVALLDVASRCMAPGGRLITADTSLRAREPWSTRILAHCDRGQFIRLPEQYAELAVQRFSQVSLTVRRDMLRSPVGIGRYTTTILECGGQATDGSLGLEE